MDGSVKKYSRNESRMKHRECWSYSTRHSLNFLFVRTCTPSAFHGGHFDFFSKRIFNDCRASTSVHRRYLITTSFMVCLHELGNVSLSLLPSSFLPFLSLRGKIEGSANAPGCYFIMRRSKRVLLAECN